MRLQINRLLTLIAACVVLSAPLHAQSVQMPAQFIAERLSASECSRHYSSGRLASDLRFIEELGQQSLRSTNSLTISHDAMSDRWTRLAGVAYGAAANRHAGDSQAIVAVLVRLARSEAFLDAPSVQQALRTRCWADGNRNAPCPLHVVMHTGYAVIAMLQAAIVLEPHITGADREVLDRYFARAYRHFIEPLARNGLRADGIFEFADYGIGALAYARWTRDARLASSEMRARRSAFLSRIGSDGLIDNSSYRGHRGYWYHTLGAEAALGYALIARRFGQDFFADAQLGPRLRNLAAQTVRGADPAVFAALPPRGDNAVRDPADAIPHMHQFAVNLPLIIRSEYGFQVQTAARYRQLSSTETISRIIGFDARCYYGSG